jgi:dTDP-3-amino-3,4,6-trideoxy-alpha-D-glucose transaminase
MGLQLPPHQRVPGAPPSFNGRVDVPVTRLDNSDPTALGELMCAVERVVRADDFTLGAELVEFEREFCRLCGTGYAVGVSSGTDALALALQGLGIGPGDEVIVPANSFIATAEAVTLTGARPRLVDVDPQTHLLTAEEVERNLDGRVRGVIPVHLYGRTVDLDPIVALARERGAFVVEDACQAHGASYRGRRVGSVGDAGAFSFYPTKNLGAWGDGGAVVTSDPGLAERVRLLRSHGERPRYTHRLPGGTSRLHTIQAAVLRVKLPRLEGQNARRRRLGAVLRRELADCPGIRTPAPPPANGDHVFHLFCVVADDRDALRSHLAERGIATAVHYPIPIHLQEAYAHLGLQSGDLPVVERLAEQICSLPLFPTMTDHELDSVIDAVLEFAAR